MVFGSATLNPAVAMLMSESLLSLYPIFVKKIDLSLIHQVWARLLAYIAMASIFVDWSFIGSALFSPDAMLLAAINLSHIFFSYEGFRNLDSGVSFAIFNTYPLMILLIAGVVWNNVYLLVLLGLALFVIGEANATQSANATDKARSGVTQSATPSDKTDKANETTTQIEDGSEKPNFIYGVAMILLAALTEALIYFMIRRIKTGNHWNHVFLSYLFGFIAITGYLFRTFDFASILKPRMGLAIGLNGFLGSVAYFLRFFAASNLSASIFAPLAYFGMVMSYVYGMVFNQEMLSWEKVGGTLCILVANYMRPKT
uniref:EamA domain-containing protein n=1 Tax=viral metagenome TaxID=1070528 RepID=A0A6C0B6A0_9ZZZZ